jgi:glucosamine-6-phosphate deaminase
METNHLQPLRFTFDQLEVEIHSSREEMGLAAGLAAGEHLRTVLARQSKARIIFACAPSQNEFLAALTSQPNIAWPRVTAFHMDEYVGLRASNPASFRSYLRAHLTARVAIGQVHELAGDAADPGDECERYAALLREHPIDLVCLGIGENGHVAFNDPQVADFNDPLLVKVVELDAACREQQVNDGCFISLEAVPRGALTLTVPALISGAKLVCVVPGHRKAAAVDATLRGPRTTACPASVLRGCSTARLYLDRKSAAGWRPEIIQ